MKRFIIRFVVFCIGFTSAMAQNETVDDRLLKLDAAEDYFELMRQYELEKDKIENPLIAALLEIKLNIFLNRREKINESLLKLINDNQDKMGIADVFTYSRPLMNNAVAMGLYKEVNEDANNLLEAVKHVDPPKEVVEELEMWAEMSAGHLSYSPKKVVFKKPRVEVPMSFMRAGKEELMYIDASINGGESIPFMFDTGCQFNCGISEDLAQKFNIPITSDKITLNGTVGRAAAKYGMIDSLSIGDLTVYNVPVMIFSKENNVDTTQDGVYEVPDSIKGIYQTVIGWNLMESIGEIEILPKQREMVFTGSKADIVPNMMVYYGSIPFVDIWSGDERMAFYLDTGAASSDLLSNYYEKHKEQIDGKLTKTSECVAGLGGFREVNKYILPSMLLRFGDIEFALKDIDVMADNRLHAHNLEMNKNFYGILGLDFIRLFDKVTINLRDMYMKLKK